MKTMIKSKKGLGTNIKLSLSTVLLVSSTLATNSFAQLQVQHAGEPASKVQSVKVPSLEKYTGYYQLPTHSDFILFEVKGNTLYAKKLWDNKEYELVQQNETNFETKDGGYKVEFTEDNSGEYNSAKILGKYMSVKVNFNPEKSVQLSQAQLKKLEGSYILQKEKKYKINIQATANGLILKQLWDNKEINFTSHAEVFFLNQDRTFPMTFSLNGNQASQVTCFGNDVWVKE